MSKYLRDQIIKNLTLHREALERINSDLVEIRDAEIRRNPASNENLDPAMLTSYLIRFDDKGFLVSEFDEFLRYFDDAKDVERVILSVHSFLNRRTNRQSGKRVELGFDLRNPNNNYILAEDDDKEWTDATFSKIRDRISRLGNRNWLFRNEWSVAVVQLLGVAIGFLGSLWLATKIRPFLNVENALLFGFIAVFLVFSNLWTVLFKWIIDFGDKVWPNIRFRRPGEIHWLLRSLLEWAIFSLLAVIFARLLTAVGRAIAPLLN